MKSMKKFTSMNRALGSMRRGSTQNNVPEDTSPETQLASPEANAARSVRLFCESGGSNGQSGEEVLHLPTIVESAESSPGAAKECASAIRKFLSKDYAKKPYVQYNSIMLMRILADNPGPTFTRNIDKKFIETVKELLRNSLDPSVQQIMRQTLEAFENEKKQSDPNLLPICEMWSKEQAKMAKIKGNFTPSGPPSNFQAGPPTDNSQNYFARSHSNRQLPNPLELASRIEEAKTSAKLLTQFVQTTPPDELLYNDLIREFSDRCRSASRSIQAYMTAENPGPDNDTMLTLIETNEQLALAMSKHQRAVLQTRKALGIGAATSRETSPGGTGSGAINGASSPAAVSPLGSPPPSSQPAAPLSRNPVVPVLETEPTTNPRRISVHSDISPVDSPDDPFRDPVVTQTTHNPPFPEYEKRPALGEQYYERFSASGFNPTESYVDKQDTALEKTAMHAAVPEDSVGYTSGSRQRADSDAYSVEPQEAQRKAPVYRY